MVSLSYLFLCWLVIQAPVSSFSVVPKVRAEIKACSTIHGIEGALESASTRRSFLDNFGLTSAVLVVAASSRVAPAFASGGATAGGAYLLSAKQRYNERVKKGVQGLLAAASALEGGSVAEAKAYFSGEDVGSWKDLSSAGYLLSNAFRRNSTAAPDSLPAVKVSFFVKEE